MSMLRSGMWSSLGLAFAPCAAPQGDTTAMLRGLLVCKAD